MEQKREAAVCSSSFGRTYVSNANRAGVSCFKRFSINMGETVLEEGEEALEPRNGNPYAALHTSKSLNEVERLRLIVAKQEVEIARLKKGYWVEGVGASKKYVTGSDETTRPSKNSK